MKRHAAPIFAAILLLLPVLYVGSYLAMASRQRVVPSEDGHCYVELEYRASGDLVKGFFWPLEQIDRKVRPGAWEPPPQ